MKAAGEFTWTFSSWAGKTYLRCHASSLRCVLTVFLFACFVIFLNRGNGWGSLCLCRKHMLIASKLVDDWVNKICWLGNEWIALRESVCAGDFFFFFKEKLSPYKWFVEWMKVKSEIAQSCPTLCDPMDCSLPGFSVHGIFQARVPEWVTVSFSRGDLPDPGIEPGSPTLQADALSSEPPGKTEWMRKWENKWFK